MSIKPEELKPCPFCGKEPNISDGDSLYPTGTGWKDEGEYRSYHKGMEVPKEQWCYAAGCSELSGGCGAEMSGDTRQEAIEKWNTRAIPDTHRIVPVELLEQIAVRSPTTGLAWDKELRAIIEDKENKQ